MKEVIIGGKRYEVDDRVMMEFMSLRSKQAKLRYRISKMKHLFMEIAKTIKDKKMTDKIMALLAEDRK